MYCFQLMLQHRLIQGASTGTFHILPVLMRSLEKLYRIIDREMYSIGAQKLTMPCLAPQHLWQASSMVVVCVLFLEFVFAEFRYIL